MHILASQIWCRGSDTARGRDARLDENSAYSWSFFTTLLLLTQFPLIMFTGPAECSHGTVPHTHTHTKKNKWPCCYAVVSQAKSIIWFAYQLLVLVSYDAHYDNDKMMCPRVVEGKKKSRRGHEERTREAKLKWHGRLHRFHHNSISLAWNED